MGVVVLDPLAAYVIKTLDVTTNKKVFINVCTDPQIETPPTLDPSDIALKVTKGEDWIVPIVVSIVRQDIDKAGHECFVVDCCMNPSVVILGMEDPSVKVLTVETCIELVEDQHKYVLSRDYKFPRMKCKNTLIKTEFDATKPQSTQSLQITSDKEVDLSFKTPTAETQSRPKALSIEVLNSEETVFYLHVYRGVYNGPGPRPTHVIELEGFQPDVQLEGNVIKSGTNELKLDFRPTKNDGFYNKTDDITYIMLWK